MSELQGKSIAVDISIYIYKYHSEESLLENIYLMMMLFRNYGIIPVFVFDGKSPAEKRELLVKRKKDKNSAKNEFMLLKEQLLSATEQDRQEIITTMDVLKKQFVSINKQQIENVKALIHACGMMWIDAPGEADQLCASLVLNKKVWACLSDDMDMFVYGATRVLRYLSLMNHTVVLYHMKNILKDLLMTQQDFCKMCILSGTDYNLTSCEKNMSLNEIYSIFTKYKKEEYLDEFYEWILQTIPNYIPNKESLLQVCELFKIPEFTESFTVLQKPLNMKMIKELLEPEGFFF